MSVYNIDNFRKNRFSNLRRLKSFFKALFVIYVCSYFFLNISSYSPAALSSFMSYIKLSSALDTENLEIPFIRTQTTSLDSLYGGFVKCDKDMLSYINALGQVESTVPLVYKTPYMKKGNKNIVAFDRNGYNYSISNSYKEIYSAKTSSSILDININLKDEYVIVTDEMGYISAVTMFNSKNKEIFKWSTSNFNTITAKASDNSSLLTALCIYQEGLSLNAEVIIFNTRNGSIINSVKFTDKFPIDILYIGDNICVIFENSIAFLTNKGEIISEINCNILSSYESSTSNLVYVDNNISDLSTMHVLNSTSTALSSYEFSDNIIDYAVSQNNIYVLTQTDILKYDMYFNLIDQIEHSGGIRSLLLQESGLIYSVYTNKITKLF